ncbi:MAG: rRNA pseudouridine synthase [Oscillospiraceae bacterium]|nr:rRNA pseudouridine synthase [Oscillospiraceae bacterium]
MKGKAMQERLQKILSARGLASRRAAEDIIQQGRVKVNGETACLGMSADPDTDRIEVDGKPLPGNPERVVLMLHKPRGYVTTAKDGKGRRSVTDLALGCGLRVYPVGRLDMDSEGLLLLTNDGELANRLAHPSGTKVKIYQVTVSGYTDEGLSRLREPITLDGYRLKPVKVTLTEQVGEEAQLEFRLTEGRNRQIRRMCELCGMKVTRLVRISYAGLSLGNLKKGKWRQLSEDEVKLLK